MASPNLTMNEPTAEALELLGDGALGISECAVFCGLSRAELYRRMTKGELPYVIRGRRRLIPKRAAVRLLARGLQGGEPRPAA